jgi:cytochrome c-type biogenesis protein CcmH
MQRFALFAVLIFVTAASGFGVTQKPKVDDVAGKLACFCGTCPHLVVTQCGCSAADRIKAEVQKRIDAGMSESQILDSFVAQYGATVLAAPPKKGFDLTAWLFPFFAFFIGAGILFTYLKRQRKDAPSSPKLPRPDENAREEERRYRQILERELEDRK